MNNTAFIVNSRFVWENILLIFANDVSMNTQIMQFEVYRITNIYHILCSAGHNKLEKNTDIWNIVHPQKLSDNDTKSLK